MTDLLGDEDVCRVLSLPGPAQKSQEHKHKRYGHGEIWMNLPSLPHLVMVALIPAAAVWLGISGALAQAPSAAPAPAASASPTPSPEPSATPAPAASPATSPTPSAEQPVGGAPSVQA